jgi:translation elongation factor EF-Ts
MDSTVKVSAILDKFGKETGVKIVPTEMLRVEVGEGLEEEKVDFPAEVAEIVRTT